MNITINDILKLEPCDRGIEGLYSLVGASYDKDKYLDTDLLVSKLSLSNICWVLGELHKKEILVKLAIFSAEQVIHVYEASYDSTAPRLAIEAAKAYIKEPTEANRRACVDATSAARPATEAARAASESTASAARAAARAAYAAYATSYYSAYATATCSVAASTAYVASRVDKNAESKIREYLIQLLKEESL
jgi:hypothetical protein